MNVDYLLIGYGRDGEVKHVEYEPGSILASEVTFDPANLDSNPFLTKTFQVMVRRHLGYRYAVAIALEEGGQVSASQINMWIEKSGMKPIPKEIKGEI